MKPERPVARPAPAALLQQAQAQLDRQDWTRAAPLLEQALQSQPADATLWLALAQTRAKLGQQQAALEAARQALSLQAHNLPAALVAAQAALILQQHALCIQLLQAQPGLPQSNLGQRLLGEALRRSGQPGDAVGALMQALALRPDDIDAYLQLGFALQSLQLQGEAAECFRTVTMLSPQAVMPRAYLLHAEQHSARWQQFDADRLALREALAAKPDEAADEFCVPFALIGVPHSPAELLKSARISSRFLSRGLQPLPPRAAQPAEGRRLRIGYLSADFYEHATAALLVQLLESRDRERFEVLLFSHGRDDGSPLRARIAAACERFIDVSTLDLPGTAAVIRAAEVDILVELKGHTADSRLAALACRPAPVQVAWLGFPGPCGLDAVDYIIGDPIVTPLSHASHYSEQIAQLPRCYQPNDGRRARLAPPPRATLGLPDNALVLLSANQVYKLTPALFDAWMQILQQLPEAVLWQLSGGEQADARLRAEAQARGIAAERLVFAPKVPMAEHLQRLGAADLALDSWPCNGHTTTSDALSAGVPVLTLRGEGFSERVAASLLHTADLDALICHDVASYIDTACRLGRDEQARLSLRARLPEAIAPLFDAPRLSRELEALYQRMWQRAVAGLPPAALPAETA